MGTPIVSGVPIEKVMATQAKRLAFGTVGSIASNAFMDRYDLNPYVAMGIGMGISGLTYRGIDAVGNMDYANRFGVKSVEAAEDVKKISKVEKLTRDSVKKVINDNDMIVDEFSKLLNPKRVLTDEEQVIVDRVRQEIGLPEKGTVMAKVIPQSKIDKYLNNDPNKRYNVRGFVSIDEHSKSLKSLESVYEGNRLDYESTEYKVNWDCEIDEACKKFDIRDNVYGKIIYELDKSSDVIFPEEVPTSENYPYTGKGFTGSRNIVLPELKQTERNYVNGNMLIIHDAKTGEITELFEFSEWINGWIKVE